MHKELENYAADKEKVKKHIDSILHTGTYSAKDFEYLGGAVALYRYLSKEARGGLHKIRKELRHVLGYLFMFETTTNPIYLKFAEDELMETEKCVAHIHEEEKAEANTLIHLAKAELMKHSGGNPTTVGYAPTTAAAPSFMGGSST